mmetsp:Transcript_7060/g.23176  ORF Transcript_7060/g.23176 Transcript_7060/m.23176 type:complete len:295 (+) Transcript_7060:764-1648(+)
MPKKTLVVVLLAAAFCPAVVVALLPGPRLRPPGRSLSDHRRQQVGGGSCVEFFFPPQRPCGVGVQRRRRMQPPPLEMASLPEALALNCALASVGKALKQTALTNAGLLHATLLGVVLLSSSFGWRAYSTCVAYLVLGTAVTKVRQKEKEAEGIAEKRGGARGPENVWGSAATAALCAVGAGFFGFPTTLAVAFVASLATKLSDTTQSEIGKAFGKRTYLITTFRSVPRGTEGAVSLEGTLAGLAASVLLPLYAASVGFLGESLTDGRTDERRHRKRHRRTPSSLLFFLHPKPRS